MACHDKTCVVCFAYRSTIVQAGYGKCGIFSKQEQAVLKAVTSGMEVLGPKQELAVLVAAT